MTASATCGRFVTILFTDLESHAEMMERLGDREGRTVLREHERITRQKLRENGGSEVKSMGDGFMASFESVSEALECAIQLQRAFRTHVEGGNEPIKVRVGINAGEPIAEEDDLFGTAVILASRVGSLAVGGEIRVSDVVRQIAAGKDFRFQDRGEATVRGFRDPIRTWQLDWE